MKTEASFVIVIPSLNPATLLLDYVHELRRKTNLPILLVDDGSRDDCKYIFEECVFSEPDVLLLTHEENKGKGRALKTAFAYLLENFPNLRGCVCADSDGQHLAGDVMRCIELLDENPEAHVLGCRSFSQVHVPLRSRFGNVSMRLAFRLLVGRKILDTQTGLRGYPASFMRELLSCPGERFEFETHVFQRLGKRALVQYPIETVYLNGNSESHFSPIRDSAKIFAILVVDHLLRFARFMVSSGLSFALDFSLFYGLYHYVFSGSGGRILFSTAIARMISLVFNYLCNRCLVFRDPSRRGYKGQFSFPKYVLLAVFLYAASYGLLKGSIALLPVAAANVETTKALADLILFLLSFSVQHLFVFRPRHPADLFLQK